MNIIIKAIGQISENTIVIFVEVVDADIFLFYFFAGDLYFD